MLINELHEIKKKGIEIVREFNLKFQKLVDKMPQSIKAKGKAIFCIIQMPLREISVFI
jgi:hypothetical protein